MERFFFWTHRKYFYFSNFVACFTVFNFYFITSPFCLVQMFACKKRFVSSYLSMNVSETFIFRDFLLTLLFLRFSILYTIISSSWCGCFWMFFQVIQFSKQDIFIPSLVLFLLNSRCARGSSENCVVVKGASFQSQDVVYRKRILREVSVEKKNWEGGTYENDITQLSMSPAETAVSWFWNLLA